MSSNGFWAHGQERLAEAMLELAFEIDMLRACLSEPCSPEERRKIERRLEVLLEEYAASNESGLLLF